MEVQQRQKTYLKALTGLRFFAAIYVVLFHHAGSALSVFPTYVSRLISYGYISVSLFFILSGFVLSYTYINVQSEWSIDSQRFWTARFARIYPLYLFALIISAPAFIAKFSELGKVQSFFTGVFTISLLQAWTPWTATAWNTPAWAVSVEAFCYFLFPLFAIHINKLSSRTIILITNIFWIIALIPPLLHQQFIHQKSGWMTFIIYAPVFHVPQFLMGVCVGVLFLRSTSKTSSSQIYSKVSLLAGISFLVTFIWLALTPGIPYELPNNGLLAPIFSLLIYTLAYGRGTIAKLLSLPFLTLLGEASYAIYLLQNPLLSFLKVISEKAAQVDLVSPDFFNSFSFLLCYLFILVSISIGAFLFIETPLRRSLLSRLHRQ